MIMRHRLFVLFYVLILGALTAYLYIPDATISRLLDSPVGQVLTQAFNMVEIIIEGIGLSLFVAGLAYALFGCKCKCKCK